MKTMESIENIRPTVDQIKSFDQVLNVKRALDMDWDSARISRELTIPEELIAEVEAGEYWWIENVLDQGYVRVVDWMGDDLTIANAAKASFVKESFEMGTGEARLVNFLGRDGHFSCFRHNFITLEIKAPLEVTRQWWKYVTGTAHTDSFSTAWNEASRRYITMEPEFYIPEDTDWRLKPDNMKQGSGGPVDPGTGALLSDQLEEYVAEGRSLYQWAIDDLDIAPEVARLFLPAYGMYTVWRASTSLQGLAFFLSQRLDEGAQSEIQKYAQKVDLFAHRLWPLGTRALLQGLGREYDD